MRIRRHILIAAAMSIGLAAPAWAATEYFYDELGRLIKVVYDDDSYVEYTYDAAGNRVTVVQEEK